ncbi:rna-directed dna polymerase from mobile element jockey-like [Pitangus sulphuratus]|nr:rna-directed dna polymerase from mobile element jockey-like [Pitangus sulphuratus]
MSCVCQGCVVGPVLFSIFISDIDSESSAPFSKFAHDTKLTLAVDITEGQDVIQKDLAKLENWAHKNLRNFNNSKCKVLHLGGAIPDMSTD